MRGVDPEKGLHVAPWIEDSGDKTGLLGEVELQGKVGKVESVEEPS